MTGNRTSDVSWGSNASIALAVCSMYTSVMAFTNTSAYYLGVAPLFHSKGPFARSV